MAKMIYLVSDTYFGRSGISKRRGFASSEEMDNAMIEKWNKKVKPKDIVWHLGNFAWDIISAENALHQLNGNINIVGSELDYTMKDVLDLQPNVVSYKGYYIIESHNIVLSHWPLVDWPAKRSSRSMLLHGGDKTYKSQLDIEKRFNVNCELWSLEPVSLESLKEISDVVDENNRVK